MPNSKFSETVQKLPASQLYLRVPSIHSHTGNQRTYASPYTQVAYLRPCCCVPYKFKVHFAIYCTTLLMLNVMKLQHNYIYFRCTQRNPFVIYCDFVIGQSFRWNDPWSEYFRCCMCSVLQHCLGFMFLSLHNGSLGRTEFRVAVFAELMLFITICQVSGPARWSTILQC